MKLVFIILVIMLVAFTTMILTTNSATKVTTTINGLYTDFTKYFTTVSVITDDDSEAVNNSA